MKTFGNLEPLSADVERGQLVLNWNGKTFLRLALSAVARMAAQVVDNPESLSTEVTATARTMGEAYSLVKSKYSGTPYRIGTNSKHWVHIEKAAVQCREMGMDPTEWCEMLVSAYTEMKGGQQTVIPWPSQLHGDVAAHHIQALKARTRAAPGVKGIRKARLAAGVPIPEDMEYQRIRERMKKNIHSVDDVAYVRARQIEVYGQEKPWLAEQDKRVKAREEKPNGNDDKEI